METTIPDWLNGEQDHPEIWRATDEARCRCYASPTSWVRRGDYDALQFFGTTGQVPHDAETIYRLTMERVAFERDTVIPEAQKLCTKWGVTLLTPEQVFAEEHCQRQGYMKGVKMYPGYAWVQMVNGEYVIWAREKCGKEHYRNLNIFPRFYIFKAVTGERLSSKFNTLEEAEQILTSWQNEGRYHGVSMVVGNGLPWVIAPVAWTPFNSVQTLDDLVKAVLAFPGDWENVARAFPHHKLGDRFSVCTGIAYGDYNTVEDGRVVDNLKSTRGETKDLFIWDHTTGLSVTGVSKNGLVWDISKYTGKVTSRPLYYVLKKDGEIGMTFSRPEEGGLTPVIFPGHNIPEPFATKGATSAYNGVKTEQSRIDEDLNERWPLLWGFRWVGGSPSPNASENYFTTLKNTPESLWLKCEVKGVKIGDKVVCRERGGFQTVEIKEIASNSKRTWVRGGWSNGQYLPVREFIADLEAAALHMGAPV